MDPRKFGPQQRQARQSKLMRAKARANRNNQTVNACPFGCEDHNLDQNGYCYHLVGFSPDGKTMEPMVLENGQRKVKGKLRQPLKKGDKLVKITTNFRVYRDVPCTAEELKYIELAGDQSEARPQDEDEFTFEGEEAEVEEEEDDEEEEEATEGTAKPLTYGGKKIGE
jgi:hypothetical protein